ncbi:hypothetical protein [Aneurinibacillus migulanus]|uniref:hypothetical protein n=1 Tax=Aneurinibacillus migulanus TaxID=47500 RepID=UPI001F1C502D|nr:hypothetical protein [Aneurinibacillus migulanus]
MINRQMFMVGGKKRRKDGGRERSEKDTFAFLLLERRVARLKTTKLLTMTSSAKLPAESNPNSTYIDISIAIIKIGR